MSLEKEFQYESLPMSERIRSQLPINFNGLALCGECPGRVEIEMGGPFLGSSGELLNVVLAEVGIIRENCLVTNVFLSRPENNKIDRFFRHVTEDDTDFINRYGLYRNRIVKNDNRIDMDRLDVEIAAHQPKVIVLLGATALWRMTKANGITEARGKWILTQLPGVRHLVGMLPTFHPSAVLRDRTNKLPQFVSDFQQVHEILERLG